ncbi:tRNA (m1A) methyltransferase-like protein [Elsinoe australis]|uniref:tRNA (adenine(58)-N(1))-methyltransferase catalytic subunit TRM61 n=1 Tax=Elsinoe australis TaxID=40998 RepID=A0A4U7B9B8_9PEZI|nr:tRNA (m1A) methyltransferase-like protein [Elsinoe australis]
MSLSWWQKVTRVLGFASYNGTNPLKQALQARPSGFSAQDIVLLRPLGRPNSDGKLTKPLSLNGKIEGHKGTIHHSDIIGKRPRDIIKSTTGSAFRVHEVSLSDYVRLSRRLVTPIYPADANVIVSLFDIHVQSPAPDNSSGNRYEILEAGTGHGALTLHLSRALQGGNAPRNDGESNQDWRASRNAVLHTIDISEKYSRHAEKVVAGFRQGMYAGNVDFHVGSVSEWIASEGQRRGHEEPFLAHAFLDLPSIEDHLDAVSSRLLPDGKLIIFAPSVTQIIASYEKARKERLPLILSQVIELGTNGSSGGKEWDVRAVVPRDKLKAKKPTSVTPEQEGRAVSDDTTSEEMAESDNIEQVSIETAKIEDDAEDWKMVCRPKVGGRIVGGGFLAVFVKKGEDG